MGDPEDVDDDDDADDMTADDDTTESSVEDMVPSREAPDGKPVSTKNDRDISGAGEVDDNDQSADEAEVGVQV